MGRLDVDALADLVGPELERWHAAGLELCVVADGDVLFAGGFGVRDLERGLPVTSRTLFHHGSTAKAFTAALVGSLVDDGILDWDRPIRDYYPEVRFEDPATTERVTITDLLCHRSGLPQHEWAWIANPSVTAEELVRRLPFLDSGKDLPRFRFQYCNLTYVLAGEVIGRVTGSSWAEQMRERILSPLGMDRSVTSLDAALSDDDHALPYDERDEAAFAVPFRPTDAIGPAGGILSCAVDTAAWLLFQLGDGSVGGARVLSEASMLKSHRTHMPFDTPTANPEIVYTGYGLGWVQGSYRGRRLVWHNGGIDGFRTEMMLLPDVHIGIAACGNVSYASPFPQAIAYHIADLLLEEEPRAWSAEFRESWVKQTAAVRDAAAQQRVVAGTRPAHPIADYVGVYEHPGYGRIEVTARDEDLALQVGELEFATAHRHFETWTIAYDLLHATYPLTFVTDPDGFVSEAVIPFEDGIPPIRFLRRRDDKDS